MFKKLLRPNATQIAIFILLTLVTFLAVALIFHPETVTYTTLVLIMIPVYSISALVYWPLTKYPRLLRVVKWVVVVPVGFVILMATISQFAPAHPPKDFLITHNFIDLSQVHSYSKYRSCHGHQTIPQYSDEPVSNMQHYVYFHEYVDPSQVKIYAPFDGYVVGAGPNTMADGLTMVPKSGIPWWPFNQWRFSMSEGSRLLPKFQNSPFHEVKAGDHIGYIDALDRYGRRSNGTHLRLGVTAIPPMIKNGNGEPYKRLDSVFHYMSAEVFAEYQAAFPGIKSRDDFIFTKEWRQEHPCTFREGDAPNFDYLPEENDLETKFVPGV